MIGHLSIIEVFVFLIHILGDAFDVFFLTVF